MRWWLRAGTLALVLSGLSPCVAAADPPIDLELRALDARLARSPHDLDALAERADTLLRAGDAERALLDVASGEAVSRDPRFIVLRASCLVALEREDEALATLDDGALARLRSPFAALALRARLLFDRGDLDASVRDLDHALTLVADPDLFLLRARASVALGRDAVDGLAEGVALTGAAVLEEALVAELTRTHRASEALALLERTSGSLPEVRRLVSLARLLVMLGRSDEAREAASRAVHLAEARALARPSAAHHLELASALALEGRCAEARAHYAAGEALSPGYAHRAIPGLGRVSATLDACVEGAR